MEPNITLHWFAHPQWFQDLGEFTKEENIALFEDWTKSAFTHFGKLAIGSHLLTCPFKHPQPISCLCLVIFKVSEVAVACLVSTRVDIHRRL